VGEASKTVWYEVWGIEQGDAPPPVLLTKIPAGDDAAGAWEAAKQAAHNFLSAGATEVVVKRVGQ
jgi:hypothetical protein